MSLLQLAESFKILAADNDSGFFAAFINFNNFQYNHCKQKGEVNSHPIETVVGFENEERLCKSYPINLHWIQYCRFYLILPVFV